MGEWNGFWRGFGKGSSMDVRLPLVAVRWLFRFLVNGKCIVFHVEQRTVRLASAAHLSVYVSAIVSPCKSDSPVNL